MSEVQSHHCMFERISELTTHEQPYVITSPQLPLSCRLPNRIRFDVFLTSVFAKLKRRHVKRYSVALGVQWASRSRFCPEPRAHLIRPCNAVQHVRYVK